MATTPVRLGLTALFALALATGCAPKDDAASGKTTLRFSTYVSSPAETALMKQLVADFNAANPDVHVVHEPVPGQYETKILTMLVAKTAPDVFFLDVLQFKPFLSKEVLLPLDGFLATSKRTKLGEFIPTLVSAFQEGGKTYAVPKDFNAFALYYNKDHFDAAKQPYPDASWDLEKFRQVAKALTKVEEKRHGFSLMHGPGGLDRYLPIAKTFGVDLLAQDGTCGLRSKAAREAMDYYSGLKLVDKAAVLPAEIGSTWTGDVFGRGAASMVFEGGWLIPYLQESFPKVRYGVAELPRGPKGRSNFLLSVGYAIPKTSKHPEAAWKLIEYLTSAEAQAKNKLALPSRQAEGKAFVAENPVYGAILAGTGYAMPYEFGKKGAVIKTRVASALEEIFLGAKGSEQALSEASDDIERISQL